MSAFDEFRSRKIKVFRNGDTWTTGKKMVISNRVYRNFEQFLSQIAENVPLTAGAVRKMYSIDGTLVRSLDQIRDGGLYVASGGDSFKRVPYLLEDDIANDALKSRQSRGARRPIQSHGMLNSDINNIFNGTEKPLFTPATKAYKVMVFVNGVVNEPYKMLLNHRNCRSFEHLLRHLSSFLKLPSGNVKKVYEATSYKKLNSLHDLQDGMNLIAVTNDVIKKLPYQLVDPLFKAPSVPVGAPTIAHFFPNGDPYHMGLSVSITKKRFTGLQKLLEHLNHQIELVTGKIQQIYTMEGEGTKIQNIDDIENGKGYILVANKDPLIRIRYNTKAIQMSPSHGLDGLTLRNEHMARIRKVNEKWSVKQQKAMHEQTSFTESVKGDLIPKDEAPKQQENRNKATPKGLKKTPAQPVRQKTVDSEVESYTGDADLGNDEIYGEKEVQQFAKKSNPQSPRAPGISNKKSEPASPKTNRGSMSTTPKTELKSSKADIRSSVASPKSKAGSKGELKSSKADIRSSVASPKSKAGSKAELKSSDFRSEVASPKSVARSAVDTPKSVTRSAVASPKSVARSSVASPDPRSRLTSAGTESSAASEDEKASKSETNEKVSRPQSEVTRPQSEVTRPQSEAKSTKGSNRGSKEGLKSQKGSNDKLSRKASQDGLKPRGSEEMTRATSAGTDK